MTLRLLRIIQAEAERHPEIVTLFYETGPQRVKSAFAQLLLTWCQHGKPHIPDVSCETEQFFSLLKGEAHLKAMLHSHVQLTDAEQQAHIQACVSLFLAGYLAKTPEGGK